MWLRKEQFDLIIYTDDSHLVNSCPNFTSFGYSRFSFVSFHDLFDANGWRLNATF